MMNIKAISVNVGKALLVSALFMALSLGVSLIYGRDSGFGPLMISFVITLIVEKHWISTEGSQMGSSARTSRSENATRVGSPTPK